MSFMMRSRPNVSLFVLLGGTILAGGLGLHFLSKAAPSEAAGPTAAGGGSPAITGGTHSDVQPHSPNVMSAGDYHIEAQMDLTGKVELYVYGQKERQLYPVSTIGLDLMMEAKAIVPGEDSVPITLTPKPYPNDPKGFASRFVGAFSRRPEQDMVGLSLTLPIDNQTYRVQWRPENLRPGTFAALGDGMPQAVSSTAAQKLFLTPGGLYTEADIAANGHQTASQKFGSQMSSHNAHPKPGDRICPITDTVANPKFSWVVGGKTYLFCCPPCVEEFVKRAKTAPQTVKTPESYTQPA